MMGVRDRLALHLRCAKEARELSNASLARKFEVGESAIKCALAGYTSKALTRDESDLVQACASERNRLKSIAALHSPKAISAETGTSMTALMLIAAEIKADER